VGRLLTRSVSGDRFSATCPSVDQDYYLHQNFASDQTKNQTKLVSRDESNTKAIE
jgi:hypothetical protein